MFPVLLTLKVCAASFCLHLIFSVPIAFWLSRSKSSAAVVSSFLVTLPLIFPPVALGFLLLLLLGKNGPVGGILHALLGIRVVFSQTGVILASFIAGLPLVIRPLQAAMKRTEIKRLEEAAYTMGCGKGKTFFLVTLPQIGNTLISCLLMGTARASGEVGITMMLGGNIAGKTNTVSLEIFNCVSRGDFSTAIRLCALLALVGFIFYYLLEKYHVRGG